MSLERADVERRLLKCNFQVENAPFGKVMFPVTFSGPRNASLGLIFLFRERLKCSGWFQVFLDSLVFIG